jgi:hypothetical protein
MIRGLQSTVGADQDPPHFLKLLATEKPHTVAADGVMQNLLKSMERGSKLLTGSVKQRLDKMFTKVIVQQDSLLIRFLLINTMVLPYLVDKTISLSTRIPTTGYSYSS